jgi:hypothetical protein
MTKLPPRKREDSFDSVSPSRNFRPLHSFLPSSLFVEVTLVGTMAPNQSNRLLYENEDVQLIPTFEKKGERFSTVHQN